MRRSHSENIVLPGIFAGKSMSGGKISRMRRMFPRKIVLAASVMGLVNLGSLSAYATTSNSALAVTAYVASTCGMIADPVAVGVEISPSAVKVDCTIPTPYRISLDFGKVAESIMIGISDNGALSLQDAGLLARALGFDRRVVIGMNTLSSNGMSIERIASSYGQITSGELVALGSSDQIVTAVISY